MALGKIPPGRSQSALRPDPDPAHLHALDRQTLRPAGDRWGARPRRPGDADPAGDRGSRDGLVRLYGSALGKPPAHALVVLLAILGRCGRSRRIEAEIAIMGGRQTSMAKSRKTRCEGLLFSDLMRLDDIEIAKIQLADQRQGAGIGRPTKQIGAALGPGYQSIEAGVFPTWPAPWPDVGNRDIGRFAECASADLASKEQPPLCLVRPEIVVGHLVGAAIPGLDPRAAGVPISAIAQHAHLGFPDAKALDQIKSHAEGRCAAAHDADSIANEHIDPRVHARTNRVDALEPRVRHRTPDPGHLGPRRLKLDTDRRGGDAAAEATSDEEASVDDRFDRDGWRTWHGDATSRIGCHVFQDLSP